MRINKSNITRSCRFLPLWLLMSFWQVQIIFHLLLFSFSWKLWGFFFLIPDSSDCTQSFYWSEKWLAYFALALSNHTRNPLCVKRGPNAAWREPRWFIFTKQPQDTFHLVLPAHRSKPKFYLKKKIYWWTGWHHWGKKKLSNSIINIKESVSNTNFGHMTCWKVRIII